MKIKRFLPILLLPLIALSAHGRPQQHSFSIYWSDGEQSYHAVVPHIHFVEQSVSMEGTTTSGQFVRVSGNVPTSVISFPDPATGQEIYIHGNYIIRRQ